jgi:hypothetical protein
MTKEFGGSKAAAPPAEQPSTLATIGGIADSAIRSLANGIPFMDRIAAAGGAATGIGGKFGDYSGNLEAQRGEDKKLSEDAPGVDTRFGRLSLDTAGHLVGGALVPLGAAAKVGSLAADVPLGIKTLYGMSTGATIGGVQGLSGTKDLTDVPQVAKDTALGAIVGAGVGGAIPGAAKVIGSAYEGVANALSGKVDGMSRLASLPLIRAVAADGPAAVQARLKELGPTAMLADGGDALLGKAQGVVLNSDDAKSILNPALRARDKATNARVRSDVDSAIGPYQAGDPQTITDAITAHRSAVDSVNYPAALNNAPPVRIAPIMTDLIDRIDQAPVGSMEHRALTNLQEMLTQHTNELMLDAQGIQQYDHLGNERWRDVPSSHDDANILHKVKGELDNVIQYDAPGLGVPAGALTRQQGSLKQMRGAINDALEEQVPGYANANAVSSALARRATAVDLGTQYLGSGKTTPSPDRFAAAFNPLEQGEKIAFAKGSRGEIERVVGTKANDLQAMRGELQGEGGWNTAKIATVHGQPAADALVGSVDRNLKFRDTYNKVVENSQTSQRNAAAQEMKPSPSTEIPLFNPNATMTGIGTTLLKKGAQKSRECDDGVGSDPSLRHGSASPVRTGFGARCDACENC